MTIKTFLKESIEFAKNQFSNKWFQALTASTLLFIIFWNIIPNSPDCLKTISFGFFVVFSIIYVWKVSLKQTDNILFTKAFYWVEITCLVLLFTAHLLVSIKKYDFAVILILVMLFIIIFSWFVKSLKYMINSKNITSIIITYIYSSMVIISLFFSISVVLTNDQNYIKNEDGTILNDNFSKIYYSAETYYSSNPGDSIPVGNKMKTLAQIESIVSVIMHTILISYILSNLKLENNKLAKK